MAIWRRDIFRVIMFLSQSRFGCIISTLSEAAECGAYARYCARRIRDEPLEGAVVVIPETNMQYITNTEGKTELIQVPLLRDKHYSKLLKQDYGLVTVLVYCEAMRLMRFSLLMLRMVQCGMVLMCGFSRARRPVCNNRSAKGRLV